jgi:hypothetical protein
MLHELPYSIYMVLVTLWILVNDVILLAYATNASPYIFLQDGSVYLMVACTASRRA